MIHVPLRQDMGPESGVNLEEECLGAYRSLQLVFRTIMWYAAYLAQFHRTVCGSNRGVGWSYGYRRSAI
jgi:hypothetical protein